MDATEFDDWVAYMELEPAIEDRHDIYQSVMIDLVSKVNGSKESISIPLIDWAKRYKEENPDYIRAELDSLANMINQKKSE